MSLFTFPFPYRFRYWFITQWCNFNLWWLKVTCGLDYRVEGGEHLPNEPGIVMCKHQSTWETMALEQIFVPQSWVLKRELMRIPLFGWALALLDPIPIDRSSHSEAVRQIVQRGKERLNQGRWVVIFPEGTRVAPGERGHYHPAGAFLATRSGAKVIPVAHNAGEFWGRRQFVKRPGTITLRIGPPIDANGKKPKEINHLVEEWIESQMKEISTL
ncbi:1-acyl-sn-glycerol-3-phosphate acyltransferase [Alkalilimnicola ehrlichii]|uniref:lysophospholipid acyltransferase family protein n=1 Tax=Alkalilimnicola ehrlichii TaxID=351052 RepID=UPI001C6F4816|nr:lysophospholipid acyltransferase family protein [Alkalilimnicola ehrlichii]